MTSHSVRVRFEQFGKSPSVSERLSASSQMRDDTLSGNDDCGSATLLQLGWQPRHPRTEA